MFMIVVAFFVAAVAHPSLYIYDAYFGYRDCRNYYGREAKMNRQRGPRAVVFSVAAVALLSLAACGDAAAPSVSLLSRNTVVPVSVVTEYFPDVTKEASTGSNETSVGKPIASRSVVFASRRKEEGDGLRGSVRQRQ
jgi:hypothetical protein